MWSQNHFLFVRSIYQTIVLWCINGKTIDRRIIIFILQPRSVKQNTLDNEVRNTAGIHPGVGRPPPVDSFCKYIMSDIVRYCEIGGREIVVMVKQNNLWTTNKNFQGERPYITDIQFWQRSTSNCLGKCRPFTQPKLVCKVWNACHFQDIYCHSK